MAILTQAHQLQTLEKLTRKHAERRRLGPYQRIFQAVAFLEDKREELPYFYPALFKKFLSLWDQLMDYPYFRHLQKEAAPPGLPYRRRVWQLLILGTRARPGPDQAAPPCPGGGGPGSPLPGPAGLTRLPAAS